MSKELCNKLEWMLYHLKIISAEEFFNQNTYTDLLELMMKYEE